LAYGQRLVASSQPTARAGAAAPWAAATTGGIRTACCGGAAVKVGLGASPIALFLPKATGGDAQGLNFLFQPGQFKFLLA